MDAGDILFTLPYILIAAIFYGIYLFKTGKGKSLINKAKVAYKSGNYKECSVLLKEALWKANEKPELEKEILNELAKVYQNQGISFETNDYYTLIKQYQILYKKGSTKAFEELKKVQLLKKQFIDNLPDLTNSNG